MLAESVGETWIMWRLLAVPAGFLVVGFVVTPLLLWVGAKRIAKLPNATIGRSFLAVVFSGLAGVSVLFVVQGFSGILLMFTLTWSSVHIAMQFIFLLMVLGGALLSTWLVIRWVFKTTFVKAILAWLPTLGTAPILVPLMIWIASPALNQANRLRVETICKANLSGVGHCWVKYRAEHLGQTPESLTELMRVTESSPKLLQRPLAENDGIKGICYFYLQPLPGADPQSVIACDYADNHPGSRSVLRLNGSAFRMTSKEFADEMAKPHNQRFAAALAEAEAAQPTSRPALPTAGSKF